MPVRVASSHCTVFVVDADANSRRRLARLLDRLQFRTVCLDSAEAFLDALDEAAGVSCVISEMDLPGMSGLELCDQLQIRAPQVPLIILTRKVDVSMAVLALRKNVSDYLVKPYVERDLVNRLRHVLDQQHNPL